MSDLYQQFLDDIDNLTDEQIAELLSIINTKKPSEQKKDDQAFKVFVNSSLVKVFV